MSGPYRYVWRRTRRDRVHVVAPAPRDGHTVCGAAIKVDAGWDLRLAPKPHEAVCKLCDRMKDADTMYGRGP